MVARWLGILRTLTVAVGCTIVILAVATLVLSRYSALFVSVQSNSMAPTFRKGDGLVLKRVDPASLQIGDIATYRDPADHTITISHRIVSKNPSGIWEAGDAQHTVGPFISRASIVGKAVAVAPKLGYVSDTLHSPRGLMVLIYTPAGVTILVQLRQLSRATRRSVYRVA